MVQADGERQAQFLQAQIERARQSARTDESQTEATELLRNQNGGAAEPLQMALGKSRLANGSSNKPKILQPQSGGFEDPEASNQGEG